MNPNPVNRYPFYGNTQMPYGTVNGNINQPNYFFPQNQIYEGKLLNSPSSLDIKPPISENVEQNIPLPPEPEPEPEDIRIEKEDI